MSNQRAESVHSQTSSKQTVGHSLLESFESIRGQKATFKNVSGFFVPVDKLAEMEAMAADLLKSGNTSVEPSTLLKLTQEITTLKAEHHKAQLALEASKAQLAARKGDIDQLRKSITAKEALHKENEIDYAREVQSCRDMIAGLKSRLEEAKKNAGLLKDSDSDKSQRDAEVARLKDELSKAHKELEAVRSTRRTDEAEIARLRKEAESQAAVAAETARTIKRMETVTFADVAKMPVHARTLVANEGRLAKILGPKALDWLRQADVVARDNVRDRAYKLLQVAKSAKDSKISTLVELLTIVFEYLKVQGRNAAKRIKAFIDMVIEDIINLKVKTIQQYRDALAASNSAVKLLIEKAKEEAKPKPSRAKERNHWWSTFFRSFFLGTRKHPTKLQLLVGKVKSLSRKTVSTVASFFRGFYRHSDEKGKGVEKETLFDAEEDGFETVPPAKAARATWASRFMSVADSARESTGMDEVVAGPSSPAAL